MLRNPRTIVGVLLAANMVCLIVFQVLHGGAGYDSLYGWVGNLAMVVPTAACFACAWRGGRAGPRRSGSGSRCSCRRPAT